MSLSVATLVNWYTSSDLFTMSAREPHPLLRSMLTAITLMASPHFYPQRKALTYGVKESASLASDLSFTTI